MSCSYRFCLSGTSDTVSPLVFSDFSTNKCWYDLRYVFPTYHETPVDYLLTLDQPSKFPPTETPSLKNKSLDLDSFIENSTPDFLFILNFPLSQRSNSLIVYSSRRTPPLCQETSGHHRSHVSLTKF